MKGKFYECKHCSNVILMIEAGGGQLNCCGEQMQEIPTNDLEASIEKHIPIIKTEGNKVTIRIGEEDHPMIENHYIEWIYIKTKRQEQRVNFFPGEKPEVELHIDNDEIELVAAYCTLHGLWTTGI